MMYYLLFYILSIITIELRQHWHIWGDTKLDRNVTIYLTDDLSIRVLEYIIKFD